MNQNLELTNSIRDLLFLYTQPTDKKQSILTNISNENINAKFKAIKEIIDMTIILEGNSNHPRYHDILASFYYRCKKLNCVEELFSNQGVQDYQTYLIKAVNPTLKQFQSIDYFTSHYKKKK